MTVPHALQRLAAPNPESLAAPPTAQTILAPDGALLEAWDADHVWHAFTQMQEYEPLLIERGEGDAH